MTNDAAHQFKSLIEQEDMENQQSLSLLPDGSVDYIEQFKSTEVIGEEDTKLALDLIRGGKFNAKLFHEYFEDHTEQVLNALLSIQSNDNPLKKGGDSIAFRCSAIIIQNRQNYTVPQNTLLDILTAHMSSRPKDKYYIITVKDVVDDLPYEDKTYIYKIMSQCCKELNRSPFIFEVDLDNGKKKILEFQWNTVLSYNGSDNLDVDEDAYISFTPTNFFRLLTASSTIMHGAHYPVGISAQISSKYARQLFYYLADMKNYKEYPTATPGIFTLSLEEFQYIMQYPDSYRPTDVRRFVLDISVEEINRIDGIDFVFQYEFVKTGKPGSKKKITHIKFIISKVIDGKNSEPIEIEAKPITEEDMAPLQVLKGIGLSEQECQDVLIKYKKNQRDLIFLTQAITSVVTMNDIKSKCAVLCHIMDNGLNPNMTMEKNQKRNMQTKKNNFQNYEQRDYDYDLLEKQSKK